MYSQASPLVVVTPLRMRLGCMLVTTGPFTVWKKAVKIRLVIGVGLVDPTSALLERNLQPAGKHDRLEVVSSFSKKI